jgi:SAM-dependent methyltransferase
MDPTLEDLNAHFRRADVVQEYASFDFLLPPEEALLDRYRDRLVGGRILDLGVGAGRTTRHLTPLASEYVGVDISEPMVEACRRSFGATAGVTFEVGDACDLQRFADESFDFVLFSFNGLDLVGGAAERERALSEMRRVCRPDGLLSFSCHNLRFAEALTSYRSTLEAVREWVRGRSLGEGVRMARRAFSRTRRWRRLNPGHRRYAVVDHAMVVEERSRHELSREHYADPGERIRIEKFHVRPTVQVSWFREAGFRDVVVFSQGGADVTARVEDGLRESWWLQYAGTRDGGPGAEEMSRMDRDGSVR